ncbi:MAG: hypothetical protein RLZZ611_653 [Cyanobacteriota bacterium]|jgi:hypothetical protein
MAHRSTVPALLQGMLAPVMLCAAAADAVSAEGATGLNRVLSCGLVSKIY